MSYSDATFWNEMKQKRKDYFEFQKFDKMMFEGYFEYLGILALNPTWTKDNKDEQRRILYTLWMDPENEKKRYERWYAVRERRRTEVFDYIRKQEERLENKLQRQFDKLEQELKSKK